MSSGKRRPIIKSVMIGLPVLLLLVLLSTAIWLLTSRSGAAWLWHTLEDVAAGTVQSGNVEGDLASGFVIHGLTYHSQGWEFAVSRTEIQVRPGAWPLSVQVQKLLLRDVSVIRQASPDLPRSTTANADPASLIEAMKLPLPLEAHHVELTNIVFQENGANPLQIAESMTFQMSLYKQMDIKQLVISSELVKATAQGRLGLKPPFDLMFSMDGRYEMSTVPGAMISSIPVSLNGNGDLEKFEFKLYSRNIDLDVSGEISRPLAGFSWDISAALQQVPYTPELDGKELAFAGIRLTSRGATESWSVDMSSDLKIEDQQAATLVISATGAESAVFINHVNVKGERVDVGFGGHLDWSPQLAVQLHAVIGRLDFTPWLQDWPETGYVTGELDLNWSVNGLRIPRGRLSVSGTELALDIKADIDIAENRIETELGWKNLRWPLNTTTNVFNSPSGQLQINGDIDQWRTSGMLDIQFGDYPQGRFQIKGGGDRHSTNIELLDGEVLGGSLNGVADANWEDGLRWGAELRAQGVDPEPIIPGWPGRLDFDVGVKADSRTGHLQVRIGSLQGMLRGTRINARGGLEFAGETISFDQLELRADDAVLQLNGKANEPAGVSASFSGHLPSMLLSGASGVAEIEGRFSNHVGRRVFEMQTQALDLSWNGLGIKTLVFSTGENDPDSLIPAVNLKATELVWNDERVDEVSLLLRPDGAGHTLAASLASELLDLSATIGITAESPNDLLGSPWSGVIRDLNAVINKKYNFDLAEPSAFAWSAGSFLLHTACLQEAGGASLCLGLDHQAGSSLSLVADVTALPLDYFADTFELDFRFEQVLEGRLEWHQLGEQAPTGGAQMRITAGRVLDPVDDEPLIQSNEGKFGFVLRDGNLESGIVDIEFPGVGLIDIDFGVLDIGLDGGKTLEGRMLSELKDINELGQLVLPGFDELGGRFVSSIGLKGTATDPVFEGGFQLTDGHMYYAPIGLRLEEVEFSGRIDRRDRGSLSGKFKSGDGTGSVTGRFAFEDIDHMKMNLNISGEQLLLVDTDSLNVLTDTELEIGLSPQRVDINGHIRVPSARLTPTNLLLETVSDSEDLVVENGDAPEVAVDKLPGSQVFGRLEVSFGEDVLIKVPGVETSMSGSVVYSWSGDPMPVAEGSYILNGRVDVYGPTLEVQNGRINFPGVPANNPELNIRAQRSIFGNTEIRTAGVRAIGTLKRPVLEAFTVPITTEDRAWTLLVTGTDFDQGRGVGGFDVGTYIAPRLYVSYGISLFEYENVISARYDLKRGFGIKVTSGQRETGLDVSYTIDR